MDNTFHDIWYRIFSVHTVDLVLSRRANAHSKEWNIPSSLCNTIACPSIHEIGEQMTYAYIKYKDIYYVPRMPSLCEAREREERFVEEFGSEPFIIGPFEWEMLATKFPMLTIKLPND